MRRSPALTRGSTGERGAVAIMVALSMVMLLVAAAMVLDFGVVRGDRQRAKSTADSAVMAGLPDGICASPAAAVKCNPAAPTANPAVYDHDHKRRYDVPRGDQVVLLAERRRVR